MILPKNENFRLPDETIRKSLIVSPDSSHLAYAVQTKKGIHLEVNGIKISDFYVNIFGTQFSPDSRKVAFVAVYKNKMFVLCDGIEYGPFDDVGKTSPAFSPDSKYIAYTAKRSNQWFVYINKKKIDGPFEGFAPGGIVFSPNSKRIGYVVKKGDYWFAVDNGNKHNPFLTIIQRSWGFSPDSNKFVYIAGIDGCLKGINWIGKAAVIINGERGKAYKHEDHSSQNGLSNEIYFSPDSQIISYSVVQNGKFFFVINDEKQKEYNGIVSGWQGDPQFSLHPDFGKASFKGNCIVFSQDSQHYAYAARGYRHVLVYDGKEISNHKSIANKPIIFSPDGNYFAYAAEDEEEEVAGDYPPQLLYVNSKPLKTYASIAAMEPVFSPNSSHIAYLASSENNNYVLAVDNSEPIVIKGGPVLGSKINWIDLKTIHCMLSLPKNVISIVRYPIDLKDNFLQNCDDFQKVYSDDLERKSSKNNYQNDHESSKEIINRLTNLINLHIIEADSVEKARKNLLSQFPIDFIIVSEEILSNEKFQVIEGIGNSIEKAFQAAKREIPFNVVIENESVVIQPEFKTIQIKADNINTVKKLAQTSDAIQIKSIQLKSPERKGFLGIGKRSNLYNVNIFQQAIVKIRFRQKAKIRAQVDKLPLMHYEDPLLFFSFDLPGIWKQGEKLSPFGCTFTCQYGTMELRAGEVEDHLIDINYRKEELSKFLLANGFAKISIIECKKLAGEDNIFFFEYETPNKKNGIGMSAVHYAIQYNLQIDGIPKHVSDYTINCLLPSFRFAPDERIDHLKRLAKKRGF